MLTAVLCHGHGLFLYLTAREGMSAGSNWNWECVSCQKNEIGDFWPRWVRDFGKSLLIYSHSKFVHLAGFPGDASIGRCAHQNQSSECPMARRVSWFKGMSY